MDFLQQRWDFFSVSRGKIVYSRKEMQKVQVPILLKYIHGDIAPRKMKKISDCVF